MGVIPGVHRIEDYALVGDLQTAALVSRGGSIDWCCFPRFDSGACFAALLGEPEHGRWLLAPSGVVRRSTRRYRHDTLILESVYETDEGSVRAIEFMPPRGEAPDIVRIVEGLEGDVRMRSELAIRFDFGKIVPWVRRVDHARVAIAGPDALCLRTPVEIHGEQMTTVSEFVLRPGERIPFVLTWFPSHQEVPDEIDPEVALAETEDYWLDWAGRCDRGGDYHEETQQSLLLSEGAHIRADRRDRRGADDLAARGDRGCPQLGLPLLLAPRRDPHPAGDASRRLQRRGDGVASVAAASRRRRSRRCPDHVRDRRRAATRRA